MYIKPDLYSQVHLFCTFCTDQIVQLLSIRSHFVYSILQMDNLAGVSNVHSCKLHITHMYMCSKLYICYV